MLWAFLMQQISKQIQRVCGGFSRRIEANFYILVYNVHYNHYNLLWINKTSQKLHFKELYILFRAKLPQKKKHGIGNPVH